MAIFPLAPDQTIAQMWSNDYKLEIWGRAQQEAARRPRYDLKYILGSCKVCKNLRAQHPLRAEL